MRAVIDTNVLLSGLIWRGPPHSIVQQVWTGKIGLVCSPALIAELANVMTRSKFRTVFARSPISPDQILADIRILAEIFDPPPLPGPVSRDRDDDAVLALAAAAQPDLVISGDRDLLTLGSFAGIPIVTPADALGRIGG